MSEAREKLETAILAAGIIIKSVFVPWSHSRNAKEKNPSLNWIVTLQRNGRDVLTTDYMAGSGHCPVRKCATFKAGTHALDKAIRQECETGFPVLRYRDYGDFPTGREPIKPDTCDVVHCLVLDASVLDSGGFESWASEYGYETDSRNAEKIYRACLETALQLRAGLGEDTLQALRVAGDDY